MKRKVRVNPKTHLVCVPLECIDDGLVGDVEAYADAVTLTLVSPQAGLEDIESSLETVLKDIRLRMKMKRKNEVGQRPVEDSSLEETNLDKIRRIRKILEL